MSDDTKPSNWQQAIDGEWHGCPSLFEHDGTHVGTNKVSRASEFKDGRTTYWMETRFDATGPLMDRLEIGSRIVTAGAAFLTEGMKVTLMKEVEQAESRPADRPSTDQQ